MSYLKPLYGDDDVWPWHPQRINTIGKFRDTTKAIATNAFEIAGGYRFTKQWHDTPDGTNGEMLRKERWSLVGETMPLFINAKDLIRWLWFSKAKEKFAADVCINCGVDHTEDNQVKHHLVIGDGNWMAQPVCQNCASENYVVIDDSRAFNRLNFESERTSRIWMHRALMHTSDLTDCEDCGEPVPEHELQHTFHDTHVCEGCRDEHYVYCNDIDAYALMDECMYSDVSDQWYWDDSNMPRASTILSYSANVLHEIGNECFIKNKSVHLRNANDTLLFGLELETDTRSGYCPEDLAESVLDLNFGTYGICKNDSTVSGIEMVTLPCDLDSHLNSLQWADWCEALRPIAKGHYGNDNGIHIHMSRAAIPKLLLGKLLVFMNNPQHRVFLEMIAQRPTGSWAPQSNQEKFKRVGRAGNDPYSGKYAIMNTTAQTVECRMFNSTLLHERIFKNLEFLQALFNWCSNISAQVINSGQSSSQQLIDYIDTNYTQFPHLHSFINSRIEA